jgi:hypothetical protein
MTVQRVEAGGPSINDNFTHEMFFWFFVPLQACTSAARRHLKKSLRDL